MKEIDKSDLSFSFPPKRQRNMFFDNLPELLRPERAAKMLGISKKTIYDWRYRQSQRGIPNSLFLKINRLLYLRTEVLKEWITSQN